MLIGVVGKTNCGKSTFFKAATLAETEIANYPFATIKPHHGVGFVEVDCADKELGVQCIPRFGYCKDHKRFVPVDILDVAGLIPNAHKGEGMGLQFLNDLNQADALIHIVDVAGSTNERGEPIQPLSYDPANDVKFLEIELDYWYFEILKKGWEKLARQIQQEHSNPAEVLGAQLSGLGADVNMIKETLQANNITGMPTQWTEQQLMQLATHLRKKTKPMLIACNKIDVPGAYENFQRLKKEFPAYMFILCSAESELALREAARHELIKYIPGSNSFEYLHEEKLTDKQKNALEFIKKNILEKYNSTGVQEVIDKAVFKLLKRIVVYPVPDAHLKDKDGKILPDAYLIPENSTCLQFAYKVHTTFGDTFIRAVDIKTKRTVGKEHVLRNNDVIQIISGK